MPCKGEDLAQLLPGKTVTDVSEPFGRWFKDLTLFRGRGKKEKTAGIASSSGLKNHVPFHPE